MATPADCPPPLAARKPRLALPEGAADCHAHLFGPEARYPWSPARGYTPPDATLADYGRLHETLGVSLGVLTQPSVYGTDNSLLLDALRESPDRLRGVVTVDESITDAALAEMDALGVRGIRVNLVDRGGMPFRSMDSLREIAARIAEHGWHVELLVHVHEFPDFRDLLARLPVEVSVGHMGYMPARRGPDDPGFREFLALLRDGRCWAKLTGAYRITGEQTPPYTDVLPIARAVVEANPDRVVWGTDWPHPHVRLPMPNDGDLVDMLADWVPDARTRRRILVDNPRRLFGFS